MNGATLVTFFLIFVHYSCANSFNCTYNSGTIVELENCFITCPLRFEISAPVIILRNVTVDTFLFQLNGQIDIATGVLVLPSITIEDSHIICSDLSINGEEMVITLSTFETKKYDIIGDHLVLNNVSFHYSDHSTISLSSTLTVPLRSNAVIFRTISTDFILIIDCNTTIP